MVNKYNRGNDRKYTGSILDDKHGVLRSTVVAQPIFFP